MTNALVLSESATELSGTCRAVEDKMRQNAVVAGMILPVKFLDNFDGLPEAERSQAVKDTCAAYRRSTATLYVNQSTFASLAPAIQEAVFAHEIAHAVAHRDSLMEKLPAYADLGGFGEEFLADRLACEWGFFEGLHKERLASYGQRYVEALEQWKDEDAYLKAMRKWHLQRLAGIG